MTRHRSIGMAIPLLLASPSAAASSAEGMLTFLVGVPSLTVLATALFFAVRRPRSVPVKIALLASIFPALLYALYLVPDALSTFRHGWRGDALIGAIFLGLPVLVGGLIVRLLGKRPVREEPQ